ncbi:MAG TPA: M1 family peptidase [Bacteroidetes bacterium]|nr:M1 family peptidase [Bacteroidota bacterium]
MKYGEGKARFFVLAILLLTVFGCHTSRKAVTAPAVVIGPEAPAFIMNRPAAAPKFPYRASETHYFDLLHTRLEVSFDWEKEQLQGKARLRMSPWFAATDRLELDAKGFLIHQVAKFNGGDLLDLKYSYDNEKLSIQLDRSYSRQETLEVYIDYTARPMLLDSLVSQAAAADKGLYFINPRGNQAHKPQQLWTQGEAHGSPAWFPTFDQTNERCTQEIYITVADRFQSLSNGVLVNSTRNGNGTRTDYWRMSLPHAPYLFAMVVGDFSITKDEWRGREVSYYVDKEYGPYARLIFGNTPEMLTFFSDRLGLEYPWEKYAQVVVHDFVAGAMENTTATIHMGALQHDARAHLDNSYEDYISHELFHQWFGDLVTCESWANLTLNEGFATYGEFLWKEYKYGEDAAMEHLLGDRQSYFYEANRKQVPLIRYHHKDADAMFDGHSYQKGGQVLHMLRKLLGDDAFFAGIKVYLQKNAYTAVEIHHLRLAFEEVTGQDLNWFFDQWFLAGGHPELRVERMWENGVYALHVQQTQDLDKYPLFRLPIELDIVTGGKHRGRKVWMESADTTFVIQTAVAPDFVVVDAGKDLLIKIVKDNQSAEAWTSQLKWGQGFAQTKESMDHLKGSKLDSTALLMLRASLKHAYSGSRSLALEILDNYVDPTLPGLHKEVLTCMYDKDAGVRVRAVSFFNTHKDALTAIFSAEERSGLVVTLEQKAQDSSYAVQINALRALSEYSPEKALAIAKTLTDRPVPRLVGIISQILQKQNDAGALDFAEQQYEEQWKLGGKLGAIMGLDDYLEGQAEAVQNRGLSFLMRVAESDESTYVRLTAARGLTHKFADIPKVHTFIESQAKKEQVKMVRSIYEVALQK